ncbi:hypothetical protein PoB_003188200 [Plakobranchus ocellatus]|uniref:Uncharacterized protein n=1 Tax=Plakobranchus ocellatus TaxID=259542 RepID=A0AAV4ADN9_9GAST|nr:hypothetical protein PoB_003188200 [Plakobranchus ocellatus]
MFGVTQTPAKLSATRRQNQLHGGLCFAFIPSAAKTVPRPTTRTTREAHTKISKDDSVSIVGTQDCLVLELWEKTLSTRNEKLGRMEKAL